MRWECRIRSGSNTEIEFDFCDFPEIEDDKLGIDGEIAACLSHAEKVKCLMLSVCLATEEYSNVDFPLKWISNKSWYKEKWCEIWSASGLRLKIGSLDPLAHDLPWLHLFFACEALDTVDCWYDLNPQIFHFGHSNWSQSMSRTAVVCINYSLLIHRIFCMLCCRCQNYRQQSQSCDSYFQAWESTTYNKCLRGKLFLTGIHTMQIWKWDGNWDKSTVYSNSTHVTACEIWTLDKLQFHCQSLSCFGSVLCSVLIVKSTRRCDRSGNWVAPDLYICYARQECMLLCIVVSISLCIKFSSHTALQTFTSIAALLVGSSVSLRVCIIESVKSGLLIVSSILIFKAPSSPSQTKRSRFLNYNNKWSRSYLRGFWSDTACPMAIRVMLASIEKSMIAWAATPIIIRLIKLWVSYQVLQSRGSWTRCSKYYIFFWDLWSYTYLDCFACSEVWQIT